VSFARTPAILLIISMLACSLSGCATLLSERKYEVTMRNTGGPTYFSVHDNKNQIVESGVTPKQVTLKARSSNFLPAKYNVVYASQNGVQQHQLKAGLDWWTAGNVVIGGVPGFVVDAASGAMWKLKPEVTARIPEQSLVSNPAQGATMIAAHTAGHGSTPFASNVAARIEPPLNIQQASYDTPETTQQ
jgi:uncharacterized protein YcfL